MMRGCSTGLKNGYYMGPLTFHCCLFWLFPLFLGAVVFSHSLNVFTSLSVASVPCEARCEYNLTEWQMFCWITGTVWSLQQTKQCRRERQRSDIRPNGEGRQLLINFVLLWLFMFWKPDGRTSADTSCHSSSSSLGDIVTVHRSSISLNGKWRISRQCRRRGVCSATPALLTCSSIFGLLCGRLIPVDTHFFSFPSTLGTDGGMSWRISPHSWNTAAEISLWLRKQVLSESQKAFTSYFIRCIILTN